MKKMIVNPLVIVMLVALTMLACSSKYPGYDKTTSGLYYKLYKVSKDTTKAKLGDWVSLNMSYKYKDSTLFDSKKAMQAPVRFQLPASEFKGDIYEGIRMLSPGDSADFIINADSLFTKTFRQPKRPPFIDSNSVIHFYITMLSIDSPASMMQKEEESLKKYIEEKKIAISPAASGLYFIETLAGKGAKIDSGVWVKAHFSVSLIDGKQVFSTQERGEPMEFEFGKKFDTPGFEEGVSKMLKGGKATFIVPSKIAFGETGRGAMVPPYSTVIYNVEIVDIQSKADHDKQAAEKKKTEGAKLETNKKQEGELMKKYLVDHKITAKPTASGLIYVEKVKGTGAKAAAGKKVKVHYTGTLLNGTKFDSSRDRNEPFEFVLGQGQVIKGWDEGIAMMNVGGKATLVIPSNIAYGERDMGQIPPYSTLVFDVELMDVK
ncbi:MAG: FKBP-type peptidyl-prolyl cis-trans isomerase [Bacteroidetes bacterium]|nr:FKBP-type peptidyl-prolyl cis-trans isomerase [Bacteroidota bacterium]